MPQNVGLQSTVHTWFLIHPLQGWVTEGNGFISSMKKTTLKRRRCRDIFSVTVK